MKRSFFSLLIICLFLAGTNTVRAAAIPTGFNSWPSQSTTDTHKAWTVKFSMPLDSNSVSHSSIYVTDDDNRQVSTTLTRSADGTSVQVKPSGAYTVGKKYWLYITSELTAENGKKALAEPIAAPFLVADENSKIIEISSSYSAILTSFTVLTSPDVFAVKINSKSMIYQGNNAYSLGMTGLKTGSIVTVSAYDKNGKSLKSQKYTIK